jgi:hypothetical protein
MPRSRGAQKRQAYTIVTDGYTDTTEIPRKVFLLFWIYEQKCWNCSKKKKKKKKKRIISGEETFGSDAV